MLPDRKFKPADGEVLYHYCTPETFLAICTGKRLRFSDLFAMNDFLEVHWGYDIWEQAADSVAEKVDKAFLNDIHEIIRTSSARTLTLAACLSKNGDVLSQWRAYGGDGLGYAIGFDAKHIAQLPVEALEVEYNLQRQINEVKAVILAVHEVESKETIPRSEGFFQACAHLAFDLSSLKNPAFAEENEVRLIHLLNFADSNESFKLVDPGGTSFGKKASPQSIAFHVSKGTPVAHLDIDFTNLGNVNPIVEVVIGPKNDSLLSGVSVFMETLDIPKVKIRKSSASYR